MDNKDNKKVTIMKGKEIAQNPSLMSKQMKRRLKIIEIMKLILKIAKMNLLKKMPD